MRVCVVGRGKVGRALAEALGAAAVEHALASGRTLRGVDPRADVFLLAVPDARIREVATQLARRLATARVGASSSSGRERGSDSRRVTVLHCAGARGIDELSPLTEIGAQLGVFHPLVSFASARVASSLRGSTFTSFGQPAAVRHARALARQLSARCVVLQGDPGPAYHAAAALVANGTAALAHAGVRILQAVGFSSRDAERALSSLLASVAQNVAQLGVPAALTGPVVRGDVATVARHLEALEALDRDLARAYADLQPLIVDSALCAGLDPRAARALVRASETLRSQSSQARPAARSRRRSRTTSTR